MSRNIPKIQYLPGSEKGCQICEIPKVESATVPTFSGGHPSSTRKRNFAAPSGGPRY